MYSATRFAKFLAISSLLVLGAAALARGVAAQDDVWQLNRADYGWKTQRADVTQLVQDLISRSGVNGRVAVGNQTMGGDPAVGKEKSLRIFATNRRNEEKVFTYEEGSYVDVHMFAVPRNDWGDRDRDRDRNRDADDWGDLSVIRGFYGVQGHTANVTGLLRGMTHDGVLTASVNNSTMGGDPAVGYDKVLIVVYRYQGKEQAVAVREGNMLSLP